MAPRRCNFTAQRGLHGRVTGRRQKLVEPFQPNALGGILREEPLIKGTGIARAL